MVGGTNVKTDIGRLQRSPPNILVGTPGRIIDLLESSSLAQQAQLMSALVFDEADRLLDMGFKWDLHPLPNFTPMHQIHNAV